MLAAVSGKVAHDHPGLINHLTIPGTIGKDGTHRLLLQNSSLALKVAFDKCFQFGLVVDVKICIHEFISFLLAW